MRKVGLFIQGIILLFLLSGFCSCSEEIEDGRHEIDKWVDQLEKKDQELIKWTGLDNLQIYYLNEDGNDWIDPTDTKTFPIAHSEETDNPDKLLGKVEDKNGHGSFFEYDFNFIRYDEEEKLYYYTAPIFFDGTPEYSFPIYWGGCEDWVKVSYLYAYLNGASGFGKPFDYFPLKYEYNGVQIFSISKEDYISHKEDVYAPLKKKIFIRKTADGVSVSFNR